MRKQISARSSCPLIRNAGYLVATVDLYRYKFTIFGQSDNRRFRRLTDHDYARTLQLPSAHKLRMAARQINNGGLIAYPTEAVYGLGCHPQNKQAILQLLQLKQRSIDNGLILIAANFEQIQPYIAFINADRLTEIKTTWPGPVTWLLPAHPSVPVCLRGSHKTIAVRITAHPIAATISEKAGTALVSTSANKTGFKPARTALKVRQYFNDDKLLVIQGVTGGRTQTSAIFDAISGQQLR